MAKRMLVDATHPEETRVVVVNGNKLEELDFEIASRKQLKGNIYLARVTRVEPSLQAAFVEYGGNRHGFLAFSEIHPDYYRIPVGDRPINEREEAYPERMAPLPDNAVRGRSAAVRPSLPGGEGEADAEAGVVANPGAEAAATVLDTTSPDTVPQETAAPSDNSAAEGYSPVISGMSGNGFSGNGEYDAMAADAAYAAYLDGRDALPRAASRDLNAEEDGDLPPEPVETMGDDEELEEEAASRRRMRPLRSYKIQEVIKRRQILLVQVTKEERGGKGAALTTYLSLPGRYCVLMPNTGRGGGISRKITNPLDRKRLKEILSDLDVPDGMAVILRTAGMERSKPEIRRDLEYLVRLWDDIREQTLQSIAPALIYEEANLIKRSIRDLYADDIDEVLVEGEEGYQVARDFMRMLMPGHIKKILPYRDDTIPLFFRYQVENQIDAMHSPIVQLRSGGYIVINLTEALVAIDVNSGRATKERNIEETALKTNQEAAEEIARQLRLRDLAGLIVIDFIDMEDQRNNFAVERRLKDALKHDRARIQLGRISAFGLLELSRQRLRPSLLETNFERCPHCSGMGMVRSIESTALHVLRAIEEEGIRKRSSEITVHMPTPIALYILNQKREALANIEARYSFRVQILNDDSLIVPDLRLERVKAHLPGEEPTSSPVTVERAFSDADRTASAVSPPIPSRSESSEAERDEADDRARGEAAPASGGDAGSEDERNRRRRRNRRGGNGRRRRDEDGADTRGSVAFEAATAAHGGNLPGTAGAGADAEAHDNLGSIDADDAAENTLDTQDAGVAGPDETEEEANRRRRRRGKRGGRRRSRTRPDLPVSADALALLDADGADTEDGGRARVPAMAKEEQAYPLPVAPRPAMPVAPVPLPAVSFEPVDFDLILDGGDMPPPSSPDMPPPPPPSPMIVDVALSSAPEAPREPVSGVPQVAEVVGESTATAESGDVPATLVPVSSIPSSISIEPMPPVEPASVEPAPIETPRTGTDAVVTDTAAVVAADAAPVKPKRAPSRRKKTVAVAADDASGEAAPAASSVTPPVRGEATAVVEAEVEAATAPTPPASSKPKRATTPRTRRKKDADAGSAPLDSENQNPAVVAPKPVAVVTPAPTSTTETAAEAVEPPAAAEPPASTAVSPNPVSPEPASVAAEQPTRRGWWRPRTTDGS